MRDIPRNRYFNKVALDASCTIFGHPHIKLEEKHWPKFTTNKYYLYRINEESL